MCFLTQVWWVPALSLWYSQVT
ncbi:hypothetical protein LEMLEM_LOCUS2605 [Lemmus lemmus]